MDASLRRNVNASLGGPGGEREEQAGRGCGRGMTAHRKAMAGAFMEKTVCGSRGSTGQRGANERSGRRDGAVTHPKRRIRPSSGEIPDDKFKAAHGGILSATTTTTRIGRPLISDRASAEIEKIEMRLLCLSNYL